MTPINEVIKKKKSTNVPIWVMRQAGRYLPEFRKIRKENPNFIKLCLNSDISTEITLQPIKRYGFDAAIIFSDILMIPYGMDQKVEFKKDFGPQLGIFNIDDILKINEDNFVKKLSPIYELIKNLKNKRDLKGRDIIGFVGAPWTLLVYMINKISPKNGLNNSFFKDQVLIEKILNVLEKFIKLHIKNQIEAGATIIQIFDSWAGLLKKQDLPSYVYNPTLNLVNYIKSLGIPVICFPREINDYKEFCNIVDPDVISIDYNVDPKKIVKEIKIPVQGGMNPKVLLSNKENIKKETKRYLDIFKDHPYIFNLGHGVLPETNPHTMDYIVKLIREY